MSPGRFADGSPAVGDALLVVALDDLRGVALDFDDGHDGGLPEMQRPPGGGLGSGLGCGVRQGGDVGGCIWRPPVKIIPQSM